MAFGKIMGQINKDASTGLTLQYETLRDSRYCTSAQELLPRMEREAGWAFFA
jgi:hypothetical protein